MHDEMGEPTEEELQAAFEEQMRNIRVEDVIMQTVATLVNLAGRRLGLAAGPGEDPSADVDIGEARLAIDGARALAPLCAPEQAEPIRQALSQLQIAFAQIAGAGAAVPGSPPEGPQDAGAGPPAPPAPAAAPPADPEADRAAARSKIWTPPGT